MSVKIINQVWDTPCRTHTQKLVLVALADNSNDQRICWPSIDYLARRCDLSRQGVIIQISELIKFGMLKVRKSDGRVNVYELFPDQSTEMTSQQNIPVNAIKNQSTPSIKPVNGNDPNRNEPSLEPSSSADAVGGQQRRNQSYKKKLISLEFEKLWLAAHKKAFPNLDYKVTGSDRGQFKNFIKDEDLTPSEIVKVAEQAWQRKGDKFSKCGNVKSICYLLLKWNEIKSELNENNKPNNPRNAGIAGDSAARSRATADFVARQQRERQASAPV